jgi:hypothetical protein
MSPLLEALFTTATHQLKPVSYTVPAGSISDPERGNFILTAASRSRRRKHFRAVWVRGGALAVAAWRRAKLQPPLPPRATSRRDAPHDAAPDGAKLKLIGRCLPYQQKVCGLAAGTIKLQFKKLNLILVRASVRQMVKRKQVR